MALPRKAWSLPSRASPRFLHRACTARSCWGLPSHLPLTRSSVRPSAKMGSRAATSRLCRGMVQRSPTRPGLSCSTAMGRSPRWYSLRKWLGLGRGGRRVVWGGGVPGLPGSPSSASRIAAARAPPLSRKHRESGFSIFGRSNASSADMSKTSGHGHQPEPMRHMSGAGRVQDGLHSGAEARAFYIKTVMHIKKIWSGVHAGPLRLLRVPCLLPRACPDAGRGEGEINQIRR